MANAALVASLRGRTAKLVRQNPLAAWAAVTAIVAWNLFALSAETLSVPYLDDSSLHEQMVRFATVSLRGGHLPLTSWFPYLGLGSPQFLHYQSLPAMITGAVGLVVGPTTAYRSSLYLLLAAWPVAIYRVARLLGGGPFAASVAAVLSPFLRSLPGVGYEQPAYLWIGYGVWTQLWAGWTLPFAWAYGWRYLRSGRGLFPAVVFGALTAALHFETGYLVVLPLLVWPLVAGRPLQTRVWRAVVVIGGFLLVGAWVYVPVLAQRQWAATNEALAHGPLVNGYGAAKTIGWLISGQVLDAGRLPVITIAATVGTFAAVAAWSTDRDGVAIVIALTVCTILSFGPTTFGSTARLVPGSADLFFRRFTMGTQLAALLLAGRGVEAVVRGIISSLERRSIVTAGRSRLVAAATLFAVVLPCWWQLRWFDTRNASAVAAQRGADRTAGHELDRLIAAVRLDGGGRTYAGSPSDWGTRFLVGTVPVFKYLASRDVDEVGYTQRTAALMTGPEFHFDDQNFSDYLLFGVRYLILPAGQLPPIRALFVERSGPFALWKVETSGYFQVGRILGGLRANRTNLGERSVPLLRSELPQQQAFLSTSFEPGPPSPSVAVPQPPPPLGRVVTSMTALARGRASAVVMLRVPGVTVLSVSFDPGWRVTVDGRPRSTFMVAPALLGVGVASGLHTIAFQYVGYSHYGLLFVVAGLALIALLVAQRRRSRWLVARRANDDDAG